MLSRVADSIYWMSRYVERAENVARFIDVNLNLSLDLGPDAPNQWDPLIYTTGDDVDFYERYGAATQSNVLSFLTFDQQNPNSILSCLRCARENARTVREIISSTMWEELNKFFLLVRDATPSQVVAAPFDFFHQIRQAAYILEGSTEATMSHGEAWHFRRLARMLERADKTSRILDVKYFVLLPSVADIGTSLDTIQWAALLKSASALEAYRKVQGRITPASVAQFLLLDRDFPRAVYFCLLRAEQSLLTITGGTAGTHRNIAEQRLGRLRAEFDYMTLDDVVARGLHEFIDSLQTKINDVGNAVFETFFASQPLPST
jgi:uncharacterized alpha-E superfamily protein